jgi:membrane-bound serine protease (ClpP class)
MRTVLAVVMTFLAGLVAFPAGAGEIVCLHLDDTIQPASRRFIERGLKMAASDGAKLAVIQINTPGGLLSSTRRITSDITSSPVPVAVYVAPAGARAASAGFFILMAGDIAAMAPGTNTGASHPVGSQGQNIAGDERKKATNDAAAMMRALTSRRGRNPKLAEKAVTGSVSFTAQEALKDGLIDRVASSLDELIASLDGQEITRFDGTKVTLHLGRPSIKDVRPSQAERLLSALANPNIAYLLMALGMLGIYVELTHPGAVAPGVVGVIAMLLALYSLSVLPFNLAGIGLILVGLVLFILEVKVPSYGLLTVGGLVSFILGSMMLFTGPIPAMRVSLSVVLPTAFLLAFLMIFLLSRVVKLHHRKPLTGVEGLIGEVGEARTAMAPRGRVLVHGEYWNAIIEGAPVPRGTPVRVTRVNGGELTVVAMSTQPGAIEKEES